MTGRYRYRIWHWLDTHLAHGRVRIPSPIVGWICDHFDAAVQGVPYRDEDEP